MAGSKIEWTDETWNPIVGCSIVSPGCTNCYAMKMVLMKVARLENSIGHIDSWTDIAGYAACGAELTSEAA